MTFPYKRGASFSHLNANAVGHETVLGHLNSVADLNDTYLAQLTFGCCHCCHDPGSLIRWYLFAKKLSTASGQLVLRLHGNNFLFDHLQMTQDGEVLN